MEASVAQIVGHWLSIFLTLAILSQLYEGSPLVRHAQRLFVGVSVGYVVVLQYFETLRPNAIERLADLSLGPGRWLYLVPLGLVLLLFATRSGRHAWLGRYPLAFVVGVFAGQQIPALLGADLLAQLHATQRAVAEVAGAAGPTDAATGLGVLVLVAGTALALTRFLYAGAAPERWGRGRRLLWAAAEGIVLITFGAGLGYVCVGRFTVAADRLAALAEGGAATWVLGVALVAYLVARRRLRPTRPYGEP